MAQEVITTVVFNPRLSSFDLYILLSNPACYGAYLLPVRNKLSFSFTSV